MSNSTTLGALGRVSSSAIGRSLVALLGMGKKSVVLALVNFLPSPPYENGYDSCPALIIEVQRQPKWKAIFIFPVHTL